jgi:hypothetical protein
VFLALANPLRGAIAASTIDDFPEVHTVITSGDLYGFNAAEFLDAKEFLVALIVGGKPAQSALIC